MNHHRNPTKSGLALGKVFAGINLVWAILVAVGWAQGFVNFFLWAHMVKIPVVVQPFNLSAAISIVVVAGVIGYVFGHTFAKILNWLHRG